jgi:GT2 family glycosyltransferase
MLDVSIIIVNYKTIGYVLNAINSVEKKSYGFSYEIIVVDNNSNDNSEQTLKEYYGNRIIYIGLDKNIGFGRANNEGIKIARGRNILFLNPDTLLINNAIKILSDYLDNNQNTAICGGNLYGENNEPVFSFTCVYPSLLLVILESLSFLPVVRSLPRILYGKSNRFNYTNKIKKVKDIIGADLMIKKEICDKVGGYDARYFMYVEETDLCYRVRKLGYDIVSVPFAEIHHFIGKSFSNYTEKINFRKIEMKTQSLNIFYKSHYSLFHYTCIKNIILANIKFKALVYYFFNREKYLILDKILNIHKNIFKSTK